MQKYLRLMSNLAQEFDRVEVIQVPRSQNIGANEIAKQAASGAGLTSMVLKMKSRSVPTLKRSPPLQSKVKTAG